MSSDDALGSRLVSLFVPTRTLQVWYSLYAVVGLVACFIPLFNRLSYDSAALFGLLAGVVTPFLTLHAFEAEEISRPGGPAAPGVWTFGLLAVRHVGMLLVPMTLLCANALRVQTCDFGAGFAFWLSIPVTTTLLAQTVGWCAAAVPGDTRWLRNAIVVGAILLSAGWFGWRLAMQPPITGHQWMIGYFSGSIYDEGLSHPWSLIYYRWLNLSVAAAALSALGCWGSVSRKRGDTTAGWNDVAGYLFLLILSAASVSLLWSFSPDNGVGITRDYIEEELGGRLETEHFVIHYPQTERFIDRRQALGEDHEFRYDEMKQFFETDPAENRKIRSYVYRDREQKARLMGGRRTMVARIWLKEMHIRWPRYGHHLLAHELAHVFTFPFGAGPLRLSANLWFGVNMGLVEGIATAADWPVDEMTPHQASAALQKVDLAPDLRRIIGAGGFWTSASRRAYTLTGSFLRYLRDEYGIDKVKEAYSRGSFEAAFGMSAGQLIEQWEAYLQDEVSLDAGTMELVRYLYRRPSIFAKVCPRTIGELKRRARLAAARGEVSEARHLYDRIVGFAPKNVDFQLDYARILLEAGAVESAVDKLRDLRDKRELASVHRAKVLELLGDARWHLGEIEAARHAYRSCLDRRLPAPKIRFNTVKLESLEPRRSAVRALAFSYLVEGPDASVASYFPMEWARRRPADPLASYLVGRRLWGARVWAEAVRYLSPETVAELPAALRSEGRSLLARSLYFSEQFGRAREQFEKLRKAQSARYRWEAKEWMERLAFRTE